MDDNRYHHCLLRKIIIEHIGFEQNDRHFADVIFEWIFFKVKYHILLHISLMDAINIVVGNGLLPNREQAFM